MLVLDADGFLWFNIPIEEYEPIENFHYLPFLIKAENLNLGQITKMFKYGMERNSDSPIDLGVLLLGTEEIKRIITGADVLGRLQMRLRRIQFFGIESV